MKKKEKLLNRSIIFIATTGEEYGLLGSSYYVDHPMVPLYQTVANINIDGVAYIDEFNGIIGIGSELSNLSNYFTKNS
ncbi:MAG: M28 family peptidase [Ignavibacteriales bacterium]|nr:M28 family peptidase [Ignavibacteriales bacterium]